MCTPCFNQERMSFFNGCPFKIWLSQNVQHNDNEPGIKLSEHLNNASTADTCQLWLYASSNLWWQTWDWHLSKPGSMLEISFSFFWTPVHTFLYKHITGHVLSLERVETVCTKIVIIFIIISSNLDNAQLFHTSKLCCVYKKRRCPLHNPPVLESEEEFSRNMRHKRGGGYFLVRYLVTNIYAEL